MTSTLERRNRELSILNDVARALNQEVDLQRALQVALEKIADLWELHTGWIWLLDEQSGEPYLAVVHHLPPALANSPELMDGSAYCYCLDSYQKGDMEGAANVSMITCTRLKGLIEGTDGLRHHASVPLYGHGKKLGVLNVVSPDWRELAPDDLRLLYTAGDLISMAIERTRLFNRSIEMGATEERNRLAREIHDTLAQGLSAIVLQLETADVLLENQDTDGAQTMVQRARELSRASLEEARRSVLDLRAAPLEGRTLSRALEMLARDYAQRGQLTLEFYGGEKRALPSRIEAGLYRIAQEAITNVLRHAEASQLTVKLTTQPETIELYIADDGKGFDAETLVTEGHYGLVGLNERVRLLQGKLTISSCPDAGTQIRITVPVER